MVFKILLFVLAFLLQPLPLPLPSLLFLTALVIWLYGQKTLPPKKVLLCGICLLALKSATFLVPNPVIEEGHNVVTPSEKGWPANSHIPVAIQNALLDEFNAAHPPAKRCDETKYGCWRYFKNTQKDYAWSADGFFQTPLYSRQITKLHHTSLSSARIGAVNNMVYNFYDRVSEVKRKNMPYYVYYEIPPAYQDSTLTVQGNLFWKTGGRFVQKKYSELTSFSIPANGLIFYGVSVNPDTPLTIKLDKNLLLTFYDVLRLVLTVFAPILLLWGFFGTPRWSRVRLLTLTVGSTFLTALILRPDIYSAYPILDGGGDGLVYEGYGRHILEALKNGHILEALKGYEAIYYFMPGLRYLKALEKALVGESLMLLLCVVSFVGFFIYKTLCQFLSERASFWLTMMFSFAPLFERFGFANYHYVQKVYGGFGEPLAMMMFFCGAFLMMTAYSDGGKNRQANGGSSSNTPHYRRLFASTLAFSLSGFIRPAYLLPIAFFTGAYFFTSLFQTQTTRQRLNLIGSHLGYMTLLVMPAHNLFFGGKFVLTTSAAFHPVNLMVTPVDYLAFFKELLRFDFSGDASQKIIKHLDDWNGLSDFYRFFPLYFVLLYSFKNQTPLQVRALSLAALSSHLFLLFYIPVGRYAYLAWTLSLFVFFYAFKTRLYPKILAAKQSRQKSKALPQQNRQELKSL